MIQIAPPFVLWAAAIVLALSMRRGRDSSVLIATVLMALALTLSLPSVYSGVDALSGDVNVADLIKQTFFVAAVAFFYRAVSRSVGATESRRWAWIAPIAALVIQTVAFFLIDMDKGSVNNLMTVYGGQWAAAVYSQAHFLYFGVVVGAAGVTCLRSGYQSAPRSVRVGIRILIAGCAASVVTELLLVVRDVLRIAGLEQVSHQVDKAYGPLMLLAVLLVAIGLGVPPVSAGVERRRLARQVPGLVDGLERLRDRAAPGPHRMRLPAGARIPGGEVTPLDQVHRLVVEVRDQMFLNPGFELTPGEDDVLVQSEKLIGRVELR